MRRDAERRELADPGRDRREDADPGRDGGGPIDMAEETQRFAGKHPEINSGVRETPIDKNHRRNRLWETDHPKITETDLVQYSVIVL